MRLSNNVKISLEKARDAAILAIEIYNKPAVKFKSGGYISMMIIAWTALFHSVFFKRKIKPFYREKKRKFVIVDGDFQYWDLAYCLKYYFKSDTSNPVRKNLEFFIPLKNKIEHKSLPEIDSDIFGECQSMLLNFDEMIGREFGSVFCLRESLSFSLQLFPSHESLSRVIKNNKEAKSVIDFINNYRSSISTPVFESNKFAFKAFLIQVSNHNNKDSLPIQFVHYDKLSEDQKNELGKFVAMVKYKEGGSSNEDKLKSGEVVKLVQTGLGNLKIIRQKKEINKFNSDTHVRCWRKYKVRPNGKSMNPHQTDSKYCIYDKAHKDYLYTNAWVDFLLLKMKDEAEYSSLYGL